MAPAARRRASGRGRVAQIGGGDYGEVTQAALFLIMCTASIP
jgi:hypothetical protein